MFGGIVECLKKCFLSSISNTVFLGRMIGVVLSKSTNEFKQKPSLPTKSLHSPSSGPQSLIDGIVKVYFVSVVREKPKKIPLRAFFYF